MLAFFALSTILSMQGCSSDSDSSEETQTTPQVTTYTVSYDSAHGTKPDSIKVEENAKLSASQLASLTADGYTFDGWYDSADFLGEKITKIENSTGDITLYARFLPYTRTITFYPNYYSSYETGTTSTKNPDSSEIKLINENKGSYYLEIPDEYEQVLPFGEKTALTPVNFYADKWTFKGWNTKRDGTGDLYTDEQLLLWNSEADSEAGSDVIQITEANPSNGNYSNKIKLYAQWAKKSALIYEITLPEADEGDITLNSVSTSLYASKRNFSGTYYWYVDGNSSPSFTESVTTGNSSTFDCEKYLGKEYISYGVHTVIVKVIEYSSGSSQMVYTQTALVTLSPNSEE